VWIGLLNEEPGRVDSAKWIIERAEIGEVEIWTSTLTLAEVFKVRCGDGAKSVNPDGDRKLDEFLAQPYIVHVQVDQDIGMEARRLLRADLPALKKPNDAIHLASALWHSVDTLHTYDRDDLLPLSGMLECRNGEKLTICKPPDRPAPAPAEPTLFDGLEKDADKDIRLPETPAIEPETRHTNRAETPGNSGQVEPPKVSETSVPQTEIATSPVNIMPPPVPPIGATDDPANDHDSKINQRANDDKIETHLPPEAMPE